MRASHVLLALFALWTVAVPVRAEQQLCWFDENGTRRCDGIPFDGRNGDWIWDRVNSSLPARGPDSPSKGPSPSGGGGGGGAPGAQDADPCGELVGNPIKPATGNKLEIEDEFTTSGEMPLFLARAWNHYAPIRQTLFGSRWLSNFDLSLVVSADRSLITAHRGGAQVRYVWRDVPSAGWWEDRPEARSRIVSAAGGGYVLHADDSTVETYDARGWILTRKNWRGVGLTFQYTSLPSHGGPFLARVTHTSGRSVQFTWSTTPTGPQMTQVLDPNGNAYRYAYDVYKRLSSVVQPGTPTTTTTYHYSAKEATLLGKSLDGVRYSTFAYDANGRAILSEHAGGVERHTFAYTGNVDGTLTVLHTNPLGKQTTSVYRSGKLLSATGHAEASCPAAYREVTYDANGHEDLVTDFAGNLTDYDYSPGGLLLRKVEAAGTPEARTTTYEWDAEGRMHRQTLAGVSRTEFLYRYDGLPSSVTVTNLSANGVPNQTRTTEYRYTFHPNGMVASMTVDGPLAGAGDAVTTMADAFGNITSVSNSLGHATYYSAHNAFGQPRWESDPNDDVIERIFDARGRLLTATRWLGGAPATTRNTYDGRGNLVSVATPDGVRTQYAYDAANRLVEVTRIAAGDHGASPSAAPQAASMSIMAMQADDQMEGSEVLHFSAFAQANGIGQFACHDCEFEDRPGVPSQAKTGRIDGVAMINGNAELQGWTCQPGRVEPNDVDVYVGAPAGIGQFVVRTSANQWSDPAVAAACGLTGNTYRFRIPLFDDFRRAKPGQALYVYAISPVGGPVLLANSGLVTVPPVIEAAEFVAQEVPSSLHAGGSAVARVQMRNTGNTVWTTAKAYHLGAQNPHDNTTWGTNRSAVMGSVGPGGVATFEFPIRAPDSPGTYAFQWRMVRDGVTWFGPHTPNASIVVHPAPLDFQRFTYNANSQVVLAETGRRDRGVDSVTRRERIEYDELGRVRTTRGNAGQWTTTSYDDNGNPVAVADATGRTTRHRYDALDRLVETIDAAGGKTQLAYDVADRLVQVTDPRGLVTRYTFDGFGSLLEQRTPDSGSTRMTYNAAGQPTLITRADGSQLAYAYDALGRLTGVGNAAQSRYYVYDACPNGIGRLCEARVQDPQGITNRQQFAWTAWGAPASRTQTVHGVPDTTAWVYDGIGRVSAVTYPSGTRLQYAYANGGLAGISMGTAGVPVVTDIAYAPFGGAIAWTYGNGLARNIATDLDGRVTGISARDATTVRQSLTYQHDIADRITRVTNGIDAGMTHDFGYDALDRLTSSAVPRLITNYAYDAVGNRTAETTNGLRTNYMPAGSSNRMLMAGDTGILSHNANGNVTRWGSTHSVSYDPFNRVATYANGTTTAKYQIDAFDQRVGKWTSAGGNRRFLHEGHRLQAEVGADGRWNDYVWLGNELVGMVRNGYLSAVHTDHLGRLEVATDAAKNPVWRAQNGAFDRTVVLDQIGGLHIGFPGQYHDAESGLVQNWYRDYLPEIGRYIQVDPVGLAGGLNTYSYVGSNPVYRIDPRGLACNGLGCWNTPTELSYANTGNYGLYYQAACAGGDSYACAARVVATGQGSSVSSRIGAMFTNGNLRTALRRGGSECIEEDMDDIRKDLMNARVSQLANTSRSPIIVSSQSIKDFHNNIFSVHGASDGWSLFPVFGGDVPVFGNMGGAHWGWEWCSAPACQP